ncbi:hypothetical protein ABT120_41560 [Nonomuraea angiospora]|uniref:hypothetical protein n=1 Tax=Nonomuraea angiospora TaxID=46172 RepID=UPI00332D2A23
MGGYGATAFCAGTEPPRDKEAWERLAGVEPWATEQLLIFLPMAYTRRLLPDVSYPDGLVTPSGRASLSTGPSVRGGFGPRAVGQP